MCLTFAPRFFKKKCSWDYNLLFKQGRTERGVAFFISGNIFAVIFR